MTDIHRTRWLLPAFSVLLGVACATAFWIGGDVRSGVFAVLLMTGLGVVVLLGGRSETIRGLRGDGSDERFERIDRDATTVAGSTVLGVVLAMCLWEWAHGRTGAPYVALGAIGGAVYAVAVVVLRWRG